MIFCQLSNWVIIATRALRMEPARCAGWFEAIAWSKSLTTLSRVCVALAYFRCDGGEDGACLRWPACGGVLMPGMSAAMARSGLRKQSRSYCGYEPLRYHEEILFLFEHKIALFEKLLTKLLLRLLSYTQRLQRGHSHKHQGAAQSGDFSPLRRV